MGEYNQIEDFQLTLRNITHLIINVRLLKGTTYYLLLNDSPLNLTVSKSEIERIMDELVSGEPEPIYILTNMIYQIYKARTEHSDSDWDSLHDTLFQCTGEKYTRPELEKLLVIMFPEGLRDASYNWGMSDTPWRDDVYEWAYNNLEIKKTEQ